MSAGHTHPERRLAIGFSSQPGLRDMVRLARQAERAGFSAAFVAETRLRRDAVTAVTAVLLETTELRVGTAAVNLYTRGAALLAATWAALAEAAPGRAILGLGIGSASTLAMQGLDVTHPIGRLREYTEAIRLLWSARTVSYPGTHVTLDRATLEVRPSPPPRIFHCVGGPQALRTAARLADGIVLDVLMPAHQVARQVGQIHAAAAGRYQGEICGGLMVSIADDWRTAADRIRPTVAEYISAFPELTREMGLEEAVVARIAHATARNGVRESADLVSDELVDLVAICGSPRRCRQRIDEYRSAGLTLPVLFPAAPSLERAVAELAPEPG